MPPKRTSATVILGRPSCGGRRTSRRLQRDCVLRSARAVRPSAASEPSVPHRRSASNPFAPTGMRSLQVGRVRFPLKHMNVERIIMCITGSNRGINATAVRGRVSYAALRSTAAPGPQAGSGASYRSRRAASCRVAAAAIPFSSTMRPNPSIEGTSNIWLRQLSAAPHVKR